MKKTERMGAKRRAAVCIAAVLLAGGLLLTGCGGSASSLTGQDDDSLSVTPAADLVLEEVASNGKTYAYDWVGEMSEEELARRAQQEQEQLRSRMEEEGEDPDKIDLALQDYTVQLEREQEELQAAQQRGTSLTAQEAANLAGVLMEEVYGLALEGRTIRLYLTLTETETIEVLMGLKEPYPQKVVWEAELEKGSEQESSAQCTIDANSGKLLSCCYLPSLQEKQDCISDEWMEFVTPQQVGGELYDTQSAAYEAYLGQTKDAIGRFLALAGLDQSAAVEKIEPDGEPSAARFRITYEDKRTAIVMILWGANKVSDWGNYPWKAFSYGEAAA